MSAHAEHAAPEHTATDAEPLFSNAEIRSFEADDVEAGRAIGKMLATLFIYTLIAMSIATAWTIASISSSGTPAPEAAHH